MDSAAIGTYLIAQGPLGIYALFSTFAMWRLFSLLMAAYDARLADRTEFATILAKATEALIERPRR